MTADVEVPNFQVVEKLRSIPVIESALGTSADLYNLVKSSNDLINWVLVSAENAIGTAVENVAVPLASKFQAPIATVDAKLCQGIDVLQEKVPIVNEPTAEIYDKAKTFVTTTIPANPTFQEISNVSIKLRDDSWNKANEILSSHYGTMALSGFDKTSSLADTCIDYYLPAEEGEEDVHPHSNAECPDKVIHTVHTVSALSSKMGRRVYHKLARRFSETNVENKPEQQEANEPQQQEQNEETNETVDTPAQSMEMDLSPVRNPVVPHQPNESNA